MTTHGTAEAAASGLRDALAHPDPSVRLQAAMAAGTDPHPALVEPLIDRCAVEPDFFVRDMLTWALVRHPAGRTVPRLIGELGSATVQARSQALHTLSKIGDPAAWPAITRVHLLDPHDEVARAAWRAAVLLVPEGGETELAGLLSTQLGRGGREVHLSLSRALVGLGDAVVPFLRAAIAEGGSAARAHARATLRILDDPEAAFELGSRDLEPPSETESAAHQEPGE